MTMDPTTLSERERAVLQLVATGATNNQIADQLDITPNTVKVHIRNIFGKIGASSRTEATMIAVRSGLVAVGAPVAVSAPVAVVAADLPALVEPVSPPVSDPPPELVPEVVILPATIPVPAAVPEPAEPVRPASQHRPALLAGIVGALALILGIALTLTYTELVRGTGATAAPAPRPTITLEPLAQSGTWLARTGPGQTLVGAAALNGNGPIMVIGGSDGSTTISQMRRYDPLADRWFDLPPKPTAVRDIQAVLLGGKILVPGGTLSNGKPTDVLEIYDPQGQRWSSGPPLPAPRSGYGLAVVEGAIYLFGGWDGSKYRDEVFRYDPAARTWTQQQPMPTARAFACVAVVEGSSVYVLGGENSAGPLFTNEQYSPANEAAGDRPWRQLQPLPTQRSRVGCGVVDSEIYLFGGADGGDPLIYDARADTWRQVDSSPAPLGAQPAVAYRDGSFYIVGGAPAGEQPRDQLFQFRARYSITVP